MNPVTQTRRRQLAATLEQLRTELIAAEELLGDGAPEVYDVVIRQITELRHQVAIASGRYR